MCFISMMCVLDKGARCCHLTSVHGKMMRLIEGDDITVSNALLTWGQ